MWALARLRVILADPVGHVGPADDGYAYVQGDEEDQDAYDTIVNGGEGAGAPDALVLLIPRMLQNGMALESATGQQRSDRRVVIEAAATCLRIADIAVPCVAQLSHQSHYFLCFFIEN